MGDKFYICVGFGTVQTDSVIMRDKKNIILLFHYFARHEFHKMHSQNFFLV